MNNIFDAHAHYDDKWFDEDRIELLNSLTDGGVNFVITNGIDLKSTEEAKNLSEKYPFMYFTAGYHPECVEDMPENYLEEVEKYLSHPKCVAVGEIGLDYHWDTPRDVQKKVFIEQLQLAEKHNMPVVIHDREAHGDVMDIIRKYKPKGLLHCFSGSVELMREVIKLGMSISLGGTVTFKNARHSVECASEVPLDKLLLETDAPYLSPVPFRGKRNDSRNIEYVAEKIAQLRNLSQKEVLDITTENGKKLFSIK